MHNLRKIVWVLGGFYHFTRVPIKSLLANPTKFKSWFQNFAIPAPVSKPVSINSGLTLSFSNYIHSQLFFVVKYILLSLKNTRTVQRSKLPPYTTRPTFFVHLKPDNMPPGRRVGRAGLMEQARKQEAMARRGEEITRESVEKMKVQLQQFKQRLEQFATAHKDEIQRDASFRSQFHTMCASVGVDPLTSRKGIWSEILGVGDYYYALAIRIVQVCVTTRPINGGIISVPDLTRILERSGPSSASVSVDDVERAVTKLTALGNGFKILNAGGGTRFIQSVPTELSRDHTHVLAMCNEDGRGYVTKQSVQKNTGWTDDRVDATMDYLLQHEFAWLDAYPAQHRYWIVGLLTDFNNSESAASQNEVYPTSVHTQ